MAIVASNVEFGHIGALLLESLSYRGRQFRPFIIVLTHVPPALETTLRLRFGGLKLIFHKSGDCL